MAANRIEIANNRDAPNGMKLIVLSEVNVGRLSLSKIPIEVFDGDFGKQKVSVFGGPLLKRFNCIIDPMRNEIYLSRSHHYLESLES